MTQAHSTPAGAMPDRVVLINGAPYLFFSGTAYLCMNHNPAFTQLLIEGMQLYGTSYGASRSGNFRIPVYDIAEAAFSQQLGSEAALTLSSGFMAAQLVIRFFENKADFLYAPDSHPALLRNPTDFYSGSFSAWKETVMSHIAKASGKPPVLVCNSVDPLKLQEYDFSWLNEIQSSEPVILIVDDSHGLGITGENGRGIYESLKSYPGIEPIVVSSLAKAMGMPGGLILGTESRISDFRRSSFFTAASPMAPAYLHAYLQADSIYREERERLLKNIQYLQDTLNPATGIRSRKSYPVFGCPNAELAKYLYEKNILISSFAYPTPTDPIVTRIIVNSHHTNTDIDQLTAAIHSLTIK
jgi:8-amino-7-oxononanoate synthase